MANEYVQKQYIKNKDFSLEAVSALSAEQGGAKFNRTGWSFKNWVDEAGKTYTDLQLTSFSADVVDLTAEWQRLQYAVTYGTYDYGNIKVTAGGTNIPSGSKVDYETELTIVATPTSTGKLTSLKINGVEKLTTPTMSAFTTTFTVGAGAVSITAEFGDNTGTIRYHVGY